MKNLKIISIGVISILAVSGLVGYRIKQKNEAQTLLKKTKVNSVPITIVYPKKGKFTSTLTVSGSFLPQEEVQIIPKANGKLLFFDKVEGDYIKKGELIAEIDHAEVDAQISQAKAQVKIAQANLKLAINGPLNPQFEQAKAIIQQSKSSIAQLQANKKNLEKDLKRYQPLESTGIISKQQFSATQTQISVIDQQIESAKQQLFSSEQALQLLKSGTRPEQIEVNKAQVESAQATIKLYQAQLENYKIVAPMDGVISKKFLYNGSLVTQNTPILTLSKNQKPDLVMNVPEREINKVKIGQNVQIKEHSEKEKTFNAKVKAINPMVDNTSHLVTVRATGDKNNIKLGVILDCTILTEEKTNTMILPSDAIIRKDDKNLVYTVKNKKAVLNEVEIGLQNTEEIEVLSGLNEKDQVVLKGNVFINDGDSVNIQSESK